MTTAVQEYSKKKAQPKLVKLNKAFNLAEQWVNSMSKPSVNSKSTPTELEGRPARLGIGAIVPKESKPSQPSNPLERKLLSKLNTNKRRIDEELISSSKDGKACEEDSEDEEESKTKAFAKKKLPLDLSSASNAKKKRK